MPFFPEIAMKSSPSAAPSKSASRGNGGAAGTALVTGASSGRGLEFAKQLAAKGFTLLVAGNREAELLEAAALLRSQYGVRVEARCIDLAEAGSAAALLAWCDGMGLVPDVLINNAGMFFMEYLSARNAGKAEVMMRLHVETATLLCILFGDRMKARGSGFILNMSSMTARIPAPGIAVYSASKAYLKSFGRSFSYEMRPFGVRVTTVCPAAVDTGLYPLGDGLRKAGRALGLIWTPERMVRRALRALFRGRRVVCPGMVNALLPPLISILPARLIDRLGMAWIYRND